MDQPLHEQQLKQETAAAAAVVDEEPPASAEVGRALEDVGPLVAVAGDPDVAERGDSCCVVANQEVVAVAGEGSGLKRKRGRPAKGAPKTMALPPPSRQKREEEDVCFICFDGGSLVLCDRRGCPKAYHPACIKRDDAFFRSKAKWNCGWHICSICQKTSHYMCYTCTYSLCKGCTRDSDYVSVRGNKGLCGLCMRTVMMIEKPAQGDKPTGEVDFDDKTSWEYLFKVYWVCLKEKLGLTVHELLQAKSPWKRAPPISCKVETQHELYHLKDDKGSGSENSCIDIEANSLTDKKPKRRDKYDVSNDIGYSIQHLPSIGNMCIMKNHINPSEVVVGGSSGNVGVVKSEASGVALDVSSLLYSTGMEQPFNGFLNDKSWLYLDPTGRAQGPFSMLQLYKWNESSQFPPGLRIWRVDEKQDNSILLTDALNGKSTKNVSLPYNSRPLSLGSCVTLDHTNNIQDGCRNETRTEIHTYNQIIKHSGIEKMDGTCTQSNAKDESVRSNGLHSHSSSWTMAADGNNNERQSGNFKRREESSKCEISRHDQPRSLPSVAVFLELNENPSEILREGHAIEGNSEDNGNHGSNRTPEGQSNSGQSCQKPSESEENSGQSSGQNWEGPQPQVIHPTCSTSMWQAIFGETTDFGSIVDVDESVSDLLAEVEAMESLGGGGGSGGLESPTSIMKTDGSKNDSIEFALGLSPMLDVVKGDSLSSTGDLQAPHPSTAAQEPFRQPDVHHLQRIHGGHSSRNSEVESTFTRISWNPTHQFSWDPKC